VSVRKPVVPTLVIASFAAAAAAFAFGWGGARRAAPRAGAEPGAEGEPAAAAAEGDEVQRLRAELAKKDSVIRALTNQGIAREVEHATSAAEAVAAATRTPAARAADALEARLAAAPANAAAKAELEQALRPALDPQVLGAARVDDLGCAGALCKLAVSATTEAEVNPAVNALAQHFPKSFGATKVLPTNEGAREIFFGRTYEDLAVEDPSARP
jgi:hypothetical protein